LRRQPGLRARSSLDERSEFRSTSRAAGAGYRFQPGYRPRAGGAGKRSPNRRHPGTQALPSISLRFIQATSLLRNRALASIDGDRAVTRSNILYLVVGALVIVVAVLGYQLYQDRKKPEGMRIDVGPNGLSIEKK